MAKQFPAHLVHALPRCHALAAATSISRLDDAQLAHVPESEAAEARCKAWSPARRGSRA